MHRLLSGALAGAVVVSLNVGCATPHVLIPRAPDKTAPVEERITWAKRYNIVALGPNAGIPDELGTREYLRDLRDLRQGLSDPYLDAALDNLEGPMFWRTVATWTMIGAGAVFVGAWVTEPFLREAYGVGHPAPAIADAVTGVGAIGTIAGILWTNKTSYDVNRAESSVRLMYSHAIEENLDVEIHPNGDITGRTTAAATSVTSDNATPPTLAPAPEAVPPTTTPPVVTPDPTTAPPVTTPTP